MLRLEKSSFRKALAASRYKNLSALARKAGLHRNTIYHYLRGGAALNPALARLIKALPVDPAKLLGLHPRANKCHFDREFSSIIDEFHLRFPSYTLVLFGSRARRDAKKYSDFDVGLIDQNKIPHEKFLMMRNALDEICENSLIEINLTNLTCAPKHFIKEILPDLVFLQGSQLVFSTCLKENHG